MEGEQALASSARVGKRVQLKNLKSGSALDADLENSMLLVSGTGNAHIVICSMRVGGRRMF